MKTCIKTSCIARKMQGTTMGNRSKRAVTLLRMDKRKGVCRGNSREKSGGDSLDPCENIS